MVTSPFSPIGIHSPDELLPHFVYRLAPRERVWRCGFAMNRNSWPILPILQIAPTATSLEECNPRDGTSGLLLPPSHLASKAKRNAPALHPCARGTTPGQKPPAPDGGRPAPGARTAPARGSGKQGKSSPMRPRRIAGSLHSGYQDAGMVLGDASAIASAGLPSLTRQRTAKLPLA